MVRKYSEFRLFVKNFQNFQEILNKYEHLEKFWNSPKILINMNISKKFEIFSNVWKNKKILKFWNKCKT